MKREMGKFWPQAIPIPGTPDLDLPPDQELHSSTNKYTWRGPKVLLLETGEPSAEFPGGQYTCSLNFPLKAPCFLEKL